MDDANSFGQWMLKRIMFLGGLASVLVVALVAAHNWLKNLEETIRSENRKQAALDPLIDEVGKARELIERSKNSTAPSQKSASRLLAAGKKFAPSSPIAARICFSELIRAYNGSAQAQQAAELLNRLDQNLVKESL